MKLKALFAIPAIALIAACSGGSGGGSNGGGTTPNPTRPASESIADLASFAASGETVKSRHGVDVSSRSYDRNGVTRNVQLSGDEEVGLLTVTNGADPRQRHELIGAYGENNVKLQGSYVGDASGAVRLRSGESVQAASGTASVAMNPESGEWSFGSDLWFEDGQSGIYVGSEKGTVTGNTMVFKNADSVVVEITPDGVKNINERAGARAVFSDDGQQFFGKVNGSNNSTGFMVDAGFAGAAQKQ